MFGRGKGSTVGRSGVSSASPSRRSRDMAGNEAAGASTLNSRLRSRRGMRKGRGALEAWAEETLWQGNITFYVPRLRRGRKSESGRKQEKLLIGIETDEEQKVRYNGHEKARKWSYD